ncbi:GNAT family N-acetyltransferase, partial [Candidatus Pacearchaeota archaeon]|nr:GNAT family N-acetyltransferase [Candidatus Pacearchaeota archaeon]
MVKIRKAISKDIGKISHLHKVEYNKPPYNEGWTDENSLKKIQEYFNSKTTWIMEENGKMMGFLIGTVQPMDDGIKGFIWEIVISEKYQNKGLGKKFMEFFEGYTKSKKVSRLGLMTNTKT